MQLCRVIGAFWDEKFGNDDTELHLTGLRDTCLKKMPVSGMRRKRADSHWEHALRNLYSKSLNLVRPVNLRLSEGARIGN